jgi:hypothetical protein
MTSIYPGAHWLPVGNHGGPMTGHLGLVLHVCQGNGSQHGWFSDPAAQASSTWWVSKAGVVEQYVDADAQAWAQAAGNPTYNSVETEGFAVEPLTSLQISSLTDLYAWGHHAYGWPLALAEKPGQPGFGWHGMGGDPWGGHTGCPGALRVAQRADVLANLAPPAPEEDMIIVEFGKSVFYLLSGGRAAQVSPITIANLTQTAGIKVVPFDNSDEAAFLAAYAH